MHAAAHHKSPTPWVTQVSMTLNGYLYVHTGRTQLSQVWPRCQPSMSEAAAHRKILTVHRSGHEVGIKHRHMAVTGAAEACGYRMS